mmetsp:Transcript_21405/g.52595  ORF Transcript_21405/g.52595 Transcript_21405/m.52595 type:complete len:205 (-) Transcript_21405:523-1137(-)
MRQEAQVGALACALVELQTKSLVAAVDRHQALFVLHIITLQLQLGILQECQACIHMVRGDGGMQRSVPCRSALLSSSRWHFVEEAAGEHRVRVASNEMEQRIAIAHSGLEQCVAELALRATHHAPHKAHGQLHAGHQRQLQTLLTLGVQVVHSQFHAPAEQRPHHEDCRAHRLTRQLPLAHLFRWEKHRANEQLRVRCRRVAVN